MRAWSVLRSKSYLVWYKHVVLAWYLQAGIVLHLDGLIAIQCGIPTHTKRHWESSGSPPKSLLSNHGKAAVTGIKSTIAMRVHRVTYKGTMKLKILLELSVFMADSYGIENAHTRLTKWR